MVAAYNLYMDDSGTRHPDRQLNQTGKPDWFALGGLLVRNEDEPSCREVLAQFCDGWSIAAPLHSEEIRHRSKNFRWLERDEAQRHRFLSELEAMMMSLPVLGVACVIDRRGYHARYHHMYGSQKWSLCKSAFAICVERACKFAKNEGRRLNVFVERSDQKTDNQIRAYFDSLKETGHPFAQPTSAKYQPLTQSEITETLYDFKLKHKKSPMMQIADLFLYPMCQGGYNSDYYPYKTLKRASKLIDCKVADPSAQGVKYYCFDDPQPKN